MNEQDLTREARAALNNLTDAAPEAPEFAAMTGHIARLESAAPRRRWWGGVTAFAGAAALTLLVVGAVAFVGSKVISSSSVAAPDGTVLVGDSTGLSTEALLGIWVLESYTFGGEDVDVATAGASGRLHRTAPWIEFYPMSLRGFSGCNGFGSAEAPHIEGNTMFFREVVSTAMACMEPTPEPAMEAALHSDGVTVDISGADMTWTNDAVVLRFERTERRPYPPPEPWTSAVDWIDCSPGISISVHVKDPGRPIGNVLLDVPGVVSIEGADPFWQGLDARGSLVVHGAIGDISPPDYQLDICTETAGIRPGADLGGLTYAWVSDAGLGGVHEYTWGGRLAEMCALPDGSNLTALAERYIAEDEMNSLRPGGALPTVEEATRVLEKTQQGACATGREVGDAAFFTLVTAVHRERQSVEPEQCSTAGMVEEVEDYRPAYEGLSDRAATTRIALIEAALECDFDTLSAIAIESVPEDPAHEGTFWGAVRSPEELVDYDEQHGALRRLVLALTSVPVGASGGDAATERVRYEWPSSGGDFGDGFDLLDRWDAETIERVAALNGTTPDELILFLEDNGYTWFRVGIEENGRWLYALDKD